MDNPALIHLPKSVEPLLACLPRRILNWAEIHAFPYPEVNFSLQPWRVAFTKSEYCAHIYAQPGSSSDLSALALSTLKTFGPLSLFTKLETDFFIVRLPSDPICQIWREFYAGDPDPGTSAKLHESCRDKRPWGSPPDSPTQGDWAQDPEKVAWDRYDAVIVQDLCIPPRITRRFPQVFWSYWIGETGTPAFKASIRRPAEGYQAFLNGGSRRWRIRPSLGHHGVEFPFILQDGTSHRLLGARPWNQREGVLLEINTARQMPREIRRKLEAFGSVRENTGSPQARLEGLHRSRYFVQLAGNRLWGNAMNEAVAAGCLGIANEISMPNNRSLMLPGLTPETWTDLLKLLEKLCSDPDLGGNLQTLQSSLSDTLLCQRPLADWQNLCYRG